MGYWMSEPVVVDLFVEDIAHEAFINPVVTRVCHEVGVVPEVRAVTAIGGHPRVLKELGVYRRAVEKGARTPAPDIVVIASDANCSSFAAARQVLEQAAGGMLMAKSVIACPNPHIERWYMADPESFGGVVGVQPKPGRRKCERDRYKRILAKAVTDAGYAYTLGGIEFAPDLVTAMNWYRAGKNEQSLKHFLDALRGKVQQVKGAQ